MPAIASRLIVPAVLLLAAAGLAGCNGTIAAIEPALSDLGENEEQVGRKMIGKPYKVGGRWYHPKEDEDYDETGIASWYGARFHGRPTANGERYDKHAMTAAHPTLPLPSFVRVTVLDSGKSAVLRVNDRGPFKRGRIIDVSRAAAEKLDFKQQGTTKVRVEYLGPAPVGGGDRETRMAAAKFGEGEGGGEGRSLRDFLPFGLGGGNAEDREDEVQVASREPARDDAARAARSSAPRAVARQSPAPAQEEPQVTAVAYADEEESAAVEALITLNAEPAAEPQKRRPLPAAPVEEAEERIMGAHAIFGAIDDAAGGAGELRGAGQPQ